jgi:hypothetical protein
MLWILNEVDGEKVTYRDRCFWGAINTIALEKKLSHHVPWHMI